MRDNHKDQIERWALFVRDNPREWKKIHTEFINAQFDKHRQFIERLLEKPDGFEKIVKLYNIRNVDAYRKLLRVP